MDSPSGSGIAPGYIQTSATETTSLGSGTALSQVQVDCEGTTLTGFSQSDVASSANNNKKFRSASLASHDVTFDITAKSTVSYSLKANATYTGSTDKGGKGWSADSSASVSLYKWDGASFSLVKSLYNDDAFSVTEIWDIGTYKLESITGNSAMSWGGPTPDAITEASAYARGSYVLSATPVPEPASMTALAVGAVALLRRRKKA